MLDRVDDAVAGLNGFSEYVKMGNEYVFDANGNLTTDANKGYTSILYNHMNLPRRVGTTGQYITYIYSADGTKLAKVGTNNVVTTYAGSFVYTGSSLTYMMHPEGMYLPDGNYQYYLKDHLGNTRLVVNTSGVGGTVVQQTDYYPFGMDIASYNGGVENRYRYNGKELQTDNINGKKLDWYDYGARFYDPMLGRFHMVDPMASDFPSWTPYHYVHNNPILLVDPTGMSADWYEDEYKKLVYDETIKSQADLDTKGIKGGYKGEKGYGINEETGALQTYQPNGTITESSLASNDITVKANPVTVAIYQGQKDFIQDPRTQFAITGLTFVATGGIEGVMSLGSLATEGGNFLLNGGKTFSQFKSSYWSRNVKQTLEPIINPETGQVWKQYTELHHRFVPQRWKWAPNWLKNNRLNLTPASSLRHAQMDPYRARFAPEWVKEMYNLKWK